ncbi:DUF6541 family protein [Arthrobacter sp. 35W]|uniref:DUF6541 family protein n=1 Tax=Arthrobacter sp. 35W TaxID=1132441 RepID=UPI000406B95A
MQWLSTVPAMACALAVLLVPGLGLAWFLRMRGFAVVAAAPVLSVALIAVAATIAPFLSIPWSLLPVAALTVLACLAAHFAGVAASRTTPGFVQPRAMDRRFAAAAAGVLLAAALIGSRLLYAFGSMENISQTYDNIFHLNAIRYILDTGQASSFTVGGLTGIPFYPAGWHAVVSLTAQLSGAGIPVAVNATNLVIGAVVWPLGSILLCQQVLGQSRLAAVLAGVVSAAFGAFPLMMVDFGVLYPNLLSISLLPAALALGIQVLGLSVVPDMPPLLRWLALVIALPAVALAHPSTLMAFFAIMTPAVLFVFAAAWRRWRRDWPAARRRALVSSGGLLAGILLLGAVWQAVRPEEGAAFWPPIHSPLGSLWELLTNSLMNRPPAVLLSVLVVAGVLALLRQRRFWWVLGMFAVVCLLFLVVSSFRPGRIRDFITAIWYNDSYRLAALVPSVAVLVATVGAVWAVRWIAARIGQLRPRTAGPGAAGLAGKAPWKPAAVASVAAVVVVLVLTQFGNVQYATQSAHRNYELRADSPLLTSDEMAVLRDVETLVPRDAVIASSAWNGSALAYAIAGRRTIQPHVLSSNFTLNDKIVLDSLRDSATNPLVCPAVRELHVAYVLDFGHQEVNDGSHPAPGLDNLADSGVATLLSRHGDAQLFRFTGCQ